jgi:hypothetical protein
MSAQKLITTAMAMGPGGKGLLAMDESTPICNAASLIKEQNPLADETIFNGWGKNI